MTTERTLDKFFQCQRAEFTRKKTLYFWIKDCDDFRRSKLQNFLGLPTMVTDRIFSIYQLIARNLKWPPWDYLITMTAEIFFYPFIYYYLFICFCYLFSKCYFQHWSLHILDDPLHSPSCVQLNVWPISQPKKRNIRISYSMRYKYLNKKFFGKS